MHGHLTKLIDKTKRNKKFDISDFLEFMRRKEEVETVEHLCVRIQTIYKGAYSADKLMPSFFEEEQRSHAMAEVYPQQQQQTLYKSDGEWRREGGRGRRGREGEEREGGGGKEGRRGRGREGERGRGREEREGGKRGREGGGMGRRVEEEWNGERVEVEVNRE